MTEPTAEQVNDQDRERAHTLACQLYVCSRFESCTEKCDVIATALARVRIEAHAAGRDEGLDAAEKLARERAREADRALAAIHHKRGPSDHGLWAKSEEADVIANDIRALRGRT